MAKIPSIVHFVFGLREQASPFHLLHYLAIESCRRVLQPGTIYMHYHHLPFGEFWDRIRPHLQLMQVSPSELIERTEYNEALVPQQYRYAHHADVIRLDALIEHGGIYADIDTLFLQPYPRELFDQAFVIGREQDVVDEITGESKSSLCNALLMSEPGGKFVRAWRDRLASALNGTWSNHSCLLAQELSVEMPEAVHVEPVTSFMSVPWTKQAISTLLEGGDLDTTGAHSIHLWEHLWWDSQREDFSSRHAGDLTPQYFREADTPLSRLARPFLPTLAVDDLPRTTS